MSRDQDPLTPEERALAEALARALPRGGPPPQVDAAILANARRAAAPGAPGRHPRRRRWPAALGAAASLALAVGVAWQLRPVPERAIPAASETPPPPPAAAVPDPAPAAADAPARGSREAQRTAPPSPAAMPAAGPSAPPTGGDGGRTPSPDSGERRGFHAQPPPVDAPPASPVRPPASPETQQDAPPPLASDGIPAAEPADPRPPLETAFGRRRILQDAATDDGGIVLDRRSLHAGPPATVDSPDIHRAWLDRIRELRDAGERDAARESLREYRRRHPDHALPDDLDGLLDE